MNSNLSMSRNDPNWGYRWHGDFEKFRQTGFRQMPHMVNMAFGYDYAPGRQFSYSPLGSNMTKKTSSDPRKIFVGSLPRDVSKKTLEEYFEQFGEVQDAYVIKNPNTKRSRGFGFVHFKAISDVDKVMNGRPHSIDEKPVVVKRVLSAEIPENLFTSKKLFVGGLNSAHTEEGLRDYFSKFGTLDEVSIAKNREGKRRAFAILVFDDYDSVDKIIARRQHRVDGRPVAVRKYLTKEELVKVAEVKQGQPFGGLPPQRNFGQPEWAGYGYAGRVGSPAYYAGQQGYAQPVQKYQQYQPQGGYLDGYGQLPRGVQRGLPPTAGQDYKQTSSGFVKGRQEYGATPQAASTGSATGSKLPANEAAFLTKLEEAKVSQPAIQILVRENLVHPEVLTAMNRMEVHQLGLKLGDLKRIQMLLGSMGYVQ